MSINRVNISGNLTRDPELRQTQTGTAILSMGVAVNDRTLNKQTNQLEDRPNFVDCILFGKRATGIQQYLRKGTKVAIDGKLRYSSWEKDGQRPRCDLPRGGRSAYRPLGRPAFAAERSPWHGHPVPRRLDRRSP